ncbi:YrrC family ATP-dependent DNA helicase, partial [Bacillus licheniformis]
MQRHNPDQIEMEEASFVKGTVTAVIYHNETNLYTVLKVKVEETS